MLKKTSVIAAAAGLLILGSSVPAFAEGAGENPPGVGPALTANGADVVPGTVTDAPATGSEMESGIDSEAPLEENLPLPGEVDGPDLEQEKEAVPRAINCDAKYFARITKNKKNTMSVKYATFVKNQKSYEIDFKFSSKKAGTTLLGTSVNVGAEFKAMWLGKIKVDVNVKAEKSWTSELNIETGGKVKAKSTVYGDYGIQKENVYGYLGYRYSNCQVGQKQYMDAWAPYREGWVIK
ncbi:hypothetical protein [Streptomyces sp. NPDC002187]|uniref:hypothetical protein n=1 Tax=Streptomyces sp. NPDC002187 TaxID=3364637 RepID=UPI003699BF3F